MENHKQKKQKNFGVRAGQDIQQSIIGLSLENTEMDKVMNYQFTDKKLKGLTFGEIYLHTMKNIYGDYADSIEKSSDVLSMVGRVLPVTMDEMRICAELKDGTIVDEKNKLAELVTKKVTEINRVYINPSNCKTTPGIIEAIKEADCIIIGPGSLFTNIIPNLLIKKVAKTIKESKAHKVYVSNIMTEPGQTDDYTVSEHIRAIIEHAGKGVIDYCMYDTGEIVPEIVRKYNLQGYNLVDVDIAKIKSMGVKPIKGEYATVEGEYIRHDSDEIARVIIELIVNDLKFKDVKQDEQFVLMNTKLRNQKKKSPGRRAKDTSKTRRRFSRGKSKFAAKYDERIESIKNTEKTRQQNIKVHKKAKKLTTEAEQEEKERFLKETYEKK